MAFNAGGTNVGGVQSIEPGNLKLITGTTTLSNAGGETQFKYFEVPAGKKWIVKSAGFSAGGFTGTRSFAALGVRTDGVNTGGFITSTGADISFMLPQQVTLSATQELFFQIITSAYTSGQLTIKFLVQEITV
jgi:hypothetical protein